MKRKTKAPRTKRRKVGAVVLTPRDYDVLTMVGLLKHSTTEQIARELFPNPDRARRRLRQLFDAGLIDITVLSSNRPNLIAITRRGVDALIAERPAMQSHVERPEPLKLQAAAHHLLVVDARLYAAALGAKRGAPLVRWSGPQGAIHRELELDDIPLVPDGLAEFAVDDERVVVAVEADCGSESLGVLAEKFDRYVGVAAALQIDALWFVVDAGARRQRSIRELAANTGLADWTRVLSKAHVTERPVLELTPRGAGGRDSVPYTGSVPTTNTPEVSPASGGGDRHG